MFLVLGWNTVSLVCWASALPRCYIPTPWAVLNQITHRSHYCQFSKNEWAQNNEVGPVSSPVLAMGHLCSWCLGFLVPEETEGLGLGSRTFLCLCMYFQGNKRSSFPATMSCTVRVVAGQICFFCLSCPPHGPDQEGNVVQL
jgi:hypothetical protein